MRNYSIDCLKFLCAVMIVFLHVNTPYQEFILPITRCAVPIFLMISGYFLYSDEGKMAYRLVHAIKRIIGILIWSTVLFAVIKFFMVGYNSFMNISSLRFLIKFIIFNDNPYGFHLWYLSAYLYVLVIAWFVNRWNLFRWVFMVIPLLLIFDLSFGKYSILLWGREFPFIICRNWLFVGVPYFFLGVFFKQQQKKYTLKPSLTIMGG